LENIRIIDIKRKQSRIGKTRSLPKIKIQESQSPKSRKSPQSPKRTGFTFTMERKINGK